MVGDVLVATVSPALGPLLVAAWLLLWAGWEKIDRPAPTALALGRAGLRVPDVAVRGLGTVEVLVGLAAGAVGGATGLLVAVLYLGFAGFTTRQVLQARSTGEAADCGCFGDTAAPVGWTHVVVNVLLAAAGVVVAATGAAGVAAGPVGPAVAVALLALVAAYGLRAVLTDLASVRALMTPRTEG